MFHCKAYEARLLLQTQGEVSDFGHNCTNVTAASPVSVAKEQTYCYNGYISDGYSLIKHSQCVPVKT